MSELDVDPRPYWVIVEGRSMAPDYEPGDLLLVQPLPRIPLVGRIARLLTLRRGVVVIVRPLAHMRRAELKRIRSVAGDVENWGMEASARRERIPRGHVFVVGTSPDAAVPPSDSRSYGPLTLNEVVALVIYRRTGLPLVGSR